MEAVVLLDGRYAATVRFRDQPRAAMPPISWPTCRDGMAWPAR